MVETAKLKTRVIRTFGLLFSANLGLLAQSNYYLPLVVDGNNADGRLSSAITLANSGRTPAQVRLALTRHDGTPLSLSLSNAGTGSTFSLILKPGATRILQSDGTGDGSSGAVRISSDKPIGVTWSVSSLDGSGNPASGGGLPAPLSTYEFLVPIDVTAGVVTSAAIFNSNATAASLTFRFLDSGGKALESATKTLPAGQGLKLSASDLFPDLAGTAGTLDIVGDVPITAVAIRTFAAARVVGLSPAAVHASLQIRHFLPAVADGPGMGGTVKSTFLITNVSSRPANAALSLTLDDGSPMSVSLGGDPANTFQALIAPGGSVVWQTSGGDEYQAGAASITADGPINVAAAVTVYDDQENVLAEATSPESPVRARFALAFDTNSGDILPAFLVFNPAGMPLNPVLRLYDADGALISTAQIPALGPGGRTQANFSDFFPNASVAAGSVVVDTGGPLGGSLAAIALRQPNGALPFTGASGTEGNWVGAGIDVKPTLDAAHKTTATIGRTGGKLQLTDAAGNVFTLTIPPKAIQSPLAITMTAIGSASGVPGKGLIAGVQLDPDGLILAQPGTLTIQTKTTLPDTAVPIGWHGAGHGLYVNYQQPDAAILTLSLNHFSGAGAGDMSADQLTAALVQIGNQVDLENSVIASWILQAHYAIQHKQDPTPFFAMANNEYLTMFDQAIQSLLSLGMDSQDPDVLRCAMEQARAFLARGASLGLFGTGNAAADALRASVQAAINAANTLYEQVLSKQCTDKHDFLIGMELLLLAQQEAAAGHMEAEQNLVNTALKCPPTLELDFSSTLSGTVVQTTGSGTFTGTISARIPLAGALTKEALTSVSNPDQDLFTSFLFSGNAPETYDSAKATAICTITFPSLKPDTLNVMSSRGSMMTRIVYTFLLNYLPQPLLRNGEQLAEFCPICQKKALDVELLADPGSPSETTTALCGNGAPPLTLSTQFWIALWKIQHTMPGSDMEFFNGFDFPDNGVPMASKAISVKIPGPPGAEGTEKTTFTLVNPPPPTTPKN